MGALRTPRAASRARSRPGRGGWTGRNAFGRQRYAATDAALGYFGEAVRLDPQMGVAHLMIGTVLERNARQEEAIPYFRFAAGQEATANEAAFRLA